MMVESIKRHFPVIKREGCIAVALSLAHLLSPDAVLAQSGGSDLPLLGPLLGSGARPPIGAADAVNSDFMQHKSIANVKSKGKLSPRPNGASGIRTKPVLSDLPQDITGPSSARSATLIEAVKLGKPTLESLVTVNDYLNPFGLDAGGSETLSLRRALLIGLEQNLDLSISRTQTKQQQMTYYSFLGNFLPDPSFSMYAFFSGGKIGLPAGTGQLLGGGNSLLPFGNRTNPTTISVRGPFMFLRAGLDYYVFRGGIIVFGAKQAKHNYNAQKFEERSTLSDTFLQISENYYSLLLAETLLQIRIDAVRASEEQLRQNADRFQSGLATYLDVLQSKTQLARDRQSLVDQQANRRAASITLAQSLYLDLGQDIIPADVYVKKIRLIDSRLTIGDLLQIAIDNRPEIREYEELRQAAKNAIVIAGANLQPTVRLSGSVVGIGPTNNLQALGVFAVIINWRLRGFGTVDAFNVQRSRWQARQAQLEAQKELQTILAEVRNSYLQILDKETNIEEATNECQSSLEELRLAELRRAHGLGTNLDVIIAQRDHTQALVDKAQAIVAFDIAQAQLLHDLGLTSIDGLTSGRLLSKAQSP